MIGNTDRGHSWPLATRDIHTGAVHTAHPSMAARISDLARCCRVRRVGEWFVLSRTEETRRLPCVVQSCASPPIDSFPAREVTSDPPHVRARPRTSADSQGPAIEAKRASLDKQLVTQTADFPRPSHRATKPLICVSAGQGLVSMVGDTGFEPVTSSVSTIFITQEASWLSTKSVPQRPSECADMQGGCHSFSHSPPDPF
jgi:hypothetical protein